MSNTSLGTANESATVLPVPPSSSDCIIACTSGLPPVCSLPSARNPRTTSRRLLAASSSRVSARSVPRRPPLTCALIENQRDRRNLAGHALRQPRLRPQRVEAAERPGVVAAVERAHERHHFVVRRDVVAAALQIDGVMHHRPAADRDDARLQERERERVVRSSRRRPVAARRIRATVHGARAADQEPDALVFLDLRAVLAHQRFDFHDVEAAGGDDHARAAASASAPSAPRQATTWSMSVSMLMPVCFSNSRWPFS